MAARLQLSRLNVKRGLTRIFVVFAFCWYVAAGVILWPLWVSANRAVRDAGIDLSVGLVPNATAQQPGTLPIPPGATIGAAPPESTASLDAPNTLPADFFEKLDKLFPLLPPGWVLVRPPTSAGRDYVHMQLDGRQAWLSPHDAGLAKALGAKMDYAALAKQLGGIETGRATSSAQEGAEAAKADAERLSAARQLRPIGLTVSLAVVPMILWGFACALLWIGRGFQSGPGAEDQG